MKTLKEAADKHLEKVTEGYEYPEFGGIDIAEAFIAGAEYANRWIPVEEELPEKRKKVLIMTDKYEKTIGIYREITWEYQSIIFGKITHWRPIELK